MDFLIHYLVAAAIFVVIDAVWIGVVANKFYKAQMGELLAKKPRFAPAVIFYALYIVAIIVFIVQPNLADGSIGVVIGQSALLGAAMYATYDLTNLSTLKNWPIKVTIVDMIWGTFITTLVSTLTFLLFR